MNLNRKTLTIALASLTLGFAAFGAEPAESMVGRAVTDEDLSALANEVDLAAWVQVTASPDFRTIAESWVSIYSPRDAVGTAQDWSAPLAQARTLIGRTRVVRQRQWLALFIKAGDAVARKDAPRFAAALRALDQASRTPGPGLVARANIFTAK